MAKGSSRASYTWNFGKTKCGGASWCKMVGTKRNDDMSSSVPNAGYRLLRGEGYIQSGLVDRGLSRRGGGEKLSVNFVQAGLRGTTRLLGRGVVVALHNVAFSSRKAALVAKK